MKVGLAFSYYNAEKEIRRALDPWYPHVDHIIAVDGRYRTPLTPEMRRKNLPNYSTDNSEEILKQYPKVVNGRLFGTQIEKRQKCFDIAGELGCDVVIVWDSDDLIHPDYQDWNKFFKQIGAMVEHFPEEHTFKMWAWIPKVEDWSPQHNAVNPETWIKYDRVHRDPKNLKYVNSHYTWTTKDVTTEQINEWKWSHSDKMENPFYKQGNTILDGIRITTDRKLRTTDQNDFGNNWAYQNMNWEAYEYDTKPYWQNKSFTLVYEGLKRDKYPNLEYYFAPENSRGEAELIPYYVDKEGRYVIIKTTQDEDGTVTYTEVLQEALAK